MAIFYDDEGILALPRPDRLRVALDVLMGLFGRVGIQTNFNKMARMVCQTFHIADEHSEATYAKIITGAGTSFQEHQQERVSCPEREADLATR